MVDTKNKIVLITGASGEIGKCIAHELHQNGFEICLSGTRTQVLEEVAENLNERVSIVTANLAEADGAFKLMEEINQKVGEVDVLVNNAGVTRDNLLLRMTDEEWSQVLNINLSAAMSLTRLTLKPMMKKRWGRIINITSVVGVMGNPGQANYAASKAGLIGMSKAIAQEVASRGITVNCVAPGFIVSSMTEALKEEQKQTIVKNIPMRKLGTGQDVAHVVKFLASNDSSYITGQTLHVNGGLTMV